MIFGPEYHKINTVFKRDERGKILMDEFAREEFEYLLDRPWRWTEKIDGTNVRLHYSAARNEVVYGGRTDNAQVPAHLLAALLRLDVNTTTMSATFDLDPENGFVTLFGEGYGAKIQKGGGNYRPDQGFLLFDVRVGHWWLKPEDVREVAGKLGLETVPELGEMTLREAIAMTNLTAVNKPTHPREGWVSHWDGVEIEGVVGTPAVPLFTRDGSRVVAKLKVADFERLHKT